MLPAFTGELTLNEIKNIPLPTNDTVEQWHQIIERWKAFNADDKIQERLYELDKIVAESFGLTNDRLFKRLKVRLPYTARKLKGLLRGLDSSSRYR